MFDCPSLLGLVVCRRSEWRRLNFARLLNSHAALALLLTSAQILSATCLSSISIAEDRSQSGSSTTGDVAKLIGENLPDAPQGYDSMNAVMQALRANRVPLVNLKKTYRDVAVKQNLRYSMAAGERGVLDLYRPAANVRSKSKRPAGSQKQPSRIGIVLIHGGGWRTGDKTDYRYYGQSFAHAGFVAVCINYRLVPQARFPAQVQDAKAAVRWMRANADRLHVDPDRIAIMGGSAGGHLALMTAYATGVDEFEKVGDHPDVSSKVQAVINIYGPTDLTGNFKDSIAVVPQLVDEFLGKSDPARQPNAKLASPMNYVNAANPPTLIFHGTIDNVVPIHQADQLAERLQTTGVPYVYDRLAGWPHSMDVAGPVNARIVDFVTRFLHNTLPEPAANAAANSESDAANP